MLHGLKGCLVILRQPSTNILVLSIPPHSSPFFTILWNSFLFGWMGENGWNPHSYPFLIHPTYPVRFKWRNFLNMLDGEYILAFDLVPSREAYFLAHQYWRYYLCIKGCHGVFCSREVLLPWIQLLLPSMQPEGWLLLLSHAILVLVHGWY